MDTCFRPSTASVFSLDVPSSHLLSILSSSPFDPLNREGHREKSSMELELGLKVTRTSDDLTSELRIAKDRAGPLFLSRETETMFILTAYLKGFKRERIKIVINEAGNQIAISGEKPIQEMVMVKWIMYKMEPEIREFRKVFWIPDGIILDRIKAKFNDEGSILTIVMPKKTRGIRGIEIEEVKQQQFDGETSERDDVQEEVKVETVEPPKPEEVKAETKEEPKPEEVKVETKEPKPEEVKVATEEEPKPITREEESSELTSPEIVEIPATTIPDHREEIISEELAPDTTELPAEVLREELPTVQPEETEEHEIPEAKAPECEPHEHDVASVTTEPEQELHEPQTPEMPPTQQIENEELPQEEIPQVAAEEPKPEPKEQTPEMPPTPEIAKEELPQEEIPQVAAEEPKPEPKEQTPEMPPTQQIANEEQHQEEITQVPAEEPKPEPPVEEPKPEPKEQDREPEIRPPETPDLDQPAAPEIEDHGGTEEAHEVASEDKEEEVEADEEESPKAKPKKSVRDRSTQTENWPSQKPPLSPSFLTGSFLVSLIVLVIQLLRNKKKR